MKTDHEAVVLLTSPRTSSEKGVIFAILLTLNFGSSSLDPSNEPNLLSLDKDTNLESWIQKNEGKLLKIKRSWSQPFTDIEASYLGVVADLKTLSDTLKSFDESNLY
jgi:hypothetical protein